MDRILDDRVLAHLAADHEGQSCRCANRFGNVHPTILPHRLLWNIETVFVKPRGRS